MVSEVSIFKPAEIANMLFNNGSSTHIEVRVNFLRGTIPSIYGSELVLLESKDLRSMGDFIGRVNPYRTSSGNVLSFGSLFQFNFFSGKRSKFRGYVPYSGQSRTDFSANGIHIGENVAEFLRDSEFNPEFVRLLRGRYPVRGMD